MTGAEGVVFGFVTSQKTADAAVLLDGGEQFAPPGKNLVTVRLVTDVPDETIVGRIEGVMKGDGQLDGAQGSTGMSAHSRHGLEDVRANIVGYSS